MHPDSERKPDARPAAVPYVAYAVIGMSVAMLAVELALWRPSHGRLEEALIWGDQHFFALTGAQVAQGEWWRILGTVIEHAGLVHLGFNMQAVWLLGRLYERDLGSLRFLLISLAGALGSSLAVLALNFDYPYGTVGASGMILGWMGTVLPVATRDHRQMLIGNLIFVALLSVGLQFVSWQGHLGGFLAGLAAGVLLRMGPRTFWIGVPVLIGLLMIACAVVVRVEA